MFFNSQVDMERKELKYMNQLTQNDSSNICNFSFFTNKYFTYNI